MPDWVARKFRRLKVSDSSSSSSGGIGFLGLLTIVLISLKLTHLITLSWWWVWAPLWVPFAFFVVICVAIGLLSVLAHIIDKASAKARREAFRKGAAKRTP